MLYFIRVADSLSCQNWKLYLTFFNTWFLLYILFIIIICLANRCHLHRSSSFDTFYYACLSFSLHLLYIFPVKILSCTTHVTTRIIKYKMCFSQRCTLWNQGQITAVAGMFQMNPHRNLICCYQHRPLSPSQVTIWASVWNRSYVSRIWTRHTLFSRQMI